MDTPVHLSFKILNIRRHLEKVRGSLKDIKYLDQIVISHVNRLLNQMIHSIQGAINLTNNSIKFESVC